MALLNVLILAVAGPVAGEVAVPVSAQSSFNPLPELWGLHELNPDTRLADVDRSVVLYLNERAIFRNEGGAGRIYFGGGRQVAAHGEFTEFEIAEYLRSHSCLCALEYEAGPSPGTLQIAAGVYRAASAPSLTVDASGLQRFEVKFEENGTMQARLDALTCWTYGVTVAPLARSLPGFAMLAAKRHPGFIDPPRDDRPIPQAGDQREVTRSFRMVMTESLALPATEKLVSELLAEERLDAPDLAGAAAPGFTLFLNEILTGTKVPIDHASRLRDPDPFTRYLDRQQGFGSRYWP